MQIIIPMTGYGSRFVAEGYTDLKPFIKVLGKPVIEWIVRDMYSEEERIIFVCRKEHLISIAGMRDYLNSLSARSIIFEIDNWIKKGPVYDVLKASDVIHDDEPAIINYCDFYMSWNWKKFKKAVLQRNCEGCIPCYTGFHPHLAVAKNVYASCLTDKDDNLIEIKEKFSFEKDKTKAKHSPGVYYFKTGAYLKKYCQKLIDSGQEINGEYYASLPYNFMLKDGLKVWVPVDIDYFCQWGTPEDMEECKYWLEIMRRIKR